MRPEAGQASMERNNFISALLFLMYLNSFAQDQLPLGSWRHHPNFSEIKGITSSESSLFAYSSSGYFEYNTSENEIYTSASNLKISESEITTASWIDNELWVGNKNGKIDIMGDSYTLLDDIYLDEIDNSLKSINYFYPYSDRVYACTDFGITVYNKSYNILESYRQLGTGGNSAKIIKVAVVGNSVVALNTGFVKIGDLSFNLLDYTKWSTINSPDGEIFIDMETNGDAVYILSENSKIYLLEAEELTLLYEYESGIITDFELLGDDIYFSSENEVRVVENGVDRSYYLSEEEITNLYTRHGSNVWVATSSGDLIALPGNLVVSPSQPPPNVDKLISSTEYCAAVSLPFDGYPQIQKEAFTGIFENGIWEDYTFTSSGQIVEMTEFSKNSIELITSSGAAIDFNLVDRSSTPLIDSFSDEGRVLAATKIGLAYWFALFDETLSFYSSVNGTLSEFDTGIPFPIKDLKTDGQLLYANFLPGLSQGIIVFDPLDEEFRVLTTSQGSGGLPGNSVYSIEVDRDGELWVGTNNGLAYFPFVAMEGNLNPILPVVDFFPVFRNENVLSIKADPGNRKWVGTEEGVWLFSSNATEEIQVFNTTNTPLMSNKILDIAIKENSGEVFFLTDIGISSYTEAATTAGPILSPLKIFPNPVHPQFTGDVSIRGVPYNSRVRVADVSGNLIWQGRSAGGTVSWNLHDFSGKRAAAGVYIVMASDGEGNFETYGKLVITE